MGDTLPSLLKLPTDLYQEDLNLGESNFPAPRIYSMKTISFTSDAARSYQN